MAAGFAALLIGSVGAAFLGSRQANRSSSVSTSGTLQVYVTVKPVEAGTTGAVVMSEGRVITRSVRAADRPANAVTSASEISSRVAGATIAAGAVLTSDMFVVPQTHIGTIVIPAGKRALALQLQALPGIAGFAGAGDRIDVYGVSSADGSPPAVRLVLQGIDVLKVNGTGLPTAQGQPGSPDLIYLLAVTPADAERLIYLTEFEKLYFDLVPQGEGSVKTPGQGPSTALAA
jgi:Flp pilus assembly protein CpaB